MVRSHLHHKQFFSPYLLFVVLNLSAVVVVVVHVSSFRPAASSLFRRRRGLSIRLGDPQRPTEPPATRIKQLLLQASSSSSNSKISKKNRKDDEDAPLVEEYRPPKNNNTNRRGNNNGNDPDYQKRSQRWVILVDDELSIRRAVGQLLSEQGYQVTTCADAATALNVLAQAQTGSSSSGKLPDAIVSDVRMPDMDGLQFLQELRQSSASWLELPVVLLTAKGLPQDRVRGYDAGADAYLPKPFDPDELVAVVDSVIERRERLSGGGGSSSGSRQMEDLKRDLQDIKFLLLERGGGGPGRHGFVDKAGNVFLAPQERQVLELLCDGLRNREIAERTFLSTRRVEQLLTTMYRKTNVKNRTELVRWAISTGNVRV